MLEGVLADKYIMQNRAFTLESIKKMAGDIQFVSFDTIHIRDKELKSHWYKSENIDLYYFQSLDGQVVKFHISLFGQVLEWAPVAGLRTGMLIEEEIQSAVSELIQYEERVNLATIAQTQLVLRNANSVETRVCEEILNHISEFQMGRPRSPGQFFKSFAHWLLSFFK